MTLRRLAGELSRPPRLGPQRDVAHGTVEERAEPPGSIGPRALEQAAVPQALDEDVLDGVVEVLEQLRAPPARRQVGPDHGRVPGREFGPRPPRPPRRRPGAGSSRWNRESPYESRDVGHVVSRRRPADGPRCVARDRTSRLVDNATSVILPKPPSGSGERKHTPRGPPYPDPHDLRSSHHQRS